MISSDPTKPPYLSNLTYTEFLDVIEELDKDGPRGAVLLSHALLENILKRLLLSRMIALTKDENDRLFGGTGPFSSMTACTMAAYAFGLINKETKRNLDIIRKIRNRFAHTGKRIDFDDSEVIKLCNAVTLSNENPKTATDRRKLYVQVTKTLVIHLLYVIDPNATP